MDFSWSIHQHIGSIVREIGSFSEEGILGELMIVDGILMKTLGSLWPGEVASVGSLFEQCLLTEMNKRITKDWWGTDCIERRS